MRRPRSHLLALFLVLSFGSVYLIATRSSPTSRTVYIRSVAPTPTAARALGRSTPATNVRTAAPAASALAATPAAGVQASPAPDEAREVVFVARVRPPLPSATSVPSPVLTPLPVGLSTLIVNARADTYVGLDNPSTSYASSSQLLVVSGVFEKRSFLSFSVADLPATAQIISAQLSLTVVNDSSSGGQIYSLSNSNWPEASTWENQPTIDGGLMAALGPVRLNSVVTIDVSAIINGNGDYSFAIVAPRDNRNTAGYASSQNATSDWRPHLILNVWNVAATP